ncbi:MAG: glucosaminidase domain-containing protein [Clostridia bacterium]|nr:glucosaminidase domain-containing protein [Clostridia bacterium]
MKKKLFRNTLYFFIGLVGMIVYLYLYIEKKVIKLFMMFPVNLRRFIVLALIYALCNKQVVTKMITNVVFLQEPVAVKEVLADTMVCEYGEIECEIFTYAKTLGATDEQAKIMIAISKHETGNFKSSLCVNANNFGGLYNSYTKSFFKYETRSDGIKAFVNLLYGGYFKKGYDTIEKIQTKYAPTNADNDPNGLNNYWVSGVTYYYNNLP